MPVPYHLIDVAEPGHLFSVFEFQQRFYECFREITARGRMPVVVGGTGLYIESILREYRMLPVPENEALREELGKLGMEELAARLLHMNPALHNTTDLTGRERLIRAIEIAEHSSTHGSREEIERPDIAPSGDRRPLGSHGASRADHESSQGTIRAGHDRGGAATSRFRHLRGSAWTRWAWSTVT